MKATRRCEAGATLQELANGYDRSIATMRYARRMSGTAISGSDDTGKCYQSGGQALDHNAHCIDLSGVDWLLSKEAFQPPLFNFEKH